MYYFSSFPARILIPSLFILAFTARLALGGEVTLEDDSLRVAFDTNSGALTRMEDKTTHWVIERRPELGVSFRLFAPLPNRRWNPVLGQKQHAASVVKVSDQEVQLEWKDLVSENGGVLPMTLTADVTLTNGVLTFNATLQNDSALTVETIDYPYFGDFNPASRDASLQAMTRQKPQTTNMVNQEIYPHFANGKGYWGVFYPTKILQAQDSPFCLLQAPDQGVYVEMNKGFANYRLEYTFEQHPGVISTVTQLVPPEDQIAGTPVHLEFRTCHFIFAAPHSLTELAPIIVRCYQGDRHKGMDLYAQGHPNIQHP